MRKFFSNPVKNSCSDLAERSTPSTLYIPASLLDELNRKIKMHGNISKYLTHLISSYRVLISNGLIEPYSKVKTLYQEENLDLIRFDFRPVPRDWAELKCLRFSLNCSMNWIFVFLLEIDTLEIPQSIPEQFRDLVIPTIPNFSLNILGSLLMKKLQYDRFLYLRPG